MVLPTALSIAGSDSSGGAGIQADLKTFITHGVYGMSAITAITAQNTCGVIGVMDVSEDIVAAQLDAIFTDIPPQAVKIGMVSSAAIIAVIAAKLNQYQARHIVLDPVMVATSGSRLIADDAVQALCDGLIPLAELITPNLPEAEALTGLSVCGPEDMIRAAQRLHDTYGCAVLVKGGHLSGQADDILIDAKGERHTFAGERIENPNTHGTGCTLSSAIAANLARGCALPEAVRRAKKYVATALLAGLHLGHGSGPLPHQLGEVEG